MQQRGSRPHCVHRIVLSPGSVSVSVRRGRSMNTEGCGALAVGGGEGEEVDMV